MCSDNFKYDAFISYRQLEPDKSFAARLHKLLETYRTPRSLVTRGVARRLRRIFRDTDELAASSNLTESIESALRNSQFLVVLCSSRTPESEWVSREIEFFRQRGRGEHVLPLLIEGEPETSFPSQLRDALSECNEPLAADIRASARAISLRKLKREKLRIIAPILGVDFAELEQREGRRRKQRAAVGLALGLAFVFGISGVWYQGQRSTKRQAIVAQNKARTARSRDLADLARNQLDSDISLSLLLSIEADRSATTTQSRSSLLEALQRAGSTCSILKGHGNYIQALAFSPNGNTLVSTGGDGKLSLWEMLERNVHHSLSESDTMPLTTAIAFAPSGKLFAFAGQAKLQLWDGKSWTHIAEQPIGYRKIKAIAFDHTAERLISLDTSGTLSIWETPSLRLLDERIVGGRPFLLDDSQGTVVGLSAIGELLIYKENAFESVNTLQNRLDELTDSSIWSAALAPDADRVALGIWSSESDAQGGRRRKCHLRIWSISANQFLGDSLGDDELPADFLSFNSDGTLLAAAVRGSSIVDLWNLRESRRTLMDVSGGSVTALAFSHSQGPLAVGTSSGTIQVWDEPETPVLGHKINTPGEVGWATSINRDGTTLAVASRNSTIVLWDLVEGRRIQECFSGHDGSVKALSFSSGTDLLASAGEDAQIILRDARTAEPVGIKVNAEFGTTIESLAVSADGGRIAWWAEPYGELTILNVKTSERSVVDLPDNVKYADPYMLRFTHGDSRIEIATRDCHLLEWDIQTKVLRDLIEIESPQECTSIAYSSELGLIAFGHEDGNISLWDTASRRRIGGLNRGHQDPVRTLEFVPSREILVSGDGTDIVRWDLDLRSWIKLGCKIANRNFSEEEWNTYFPGEEFRQTCGTWGPFVPPRTYERPMIKYRPIKPSEVK